MPFDIGESYGGVLPVGSTNGTFPSGNTTEQQLYFWFFPSGNPEATDEILIWLNGGVSYLSMPSRSKMPAGFDCSQSCDAPHIL